MNFIKLKYHLFCICINTSCLFYGQVVHYGLDFSVEGDIGVFSNLRSKNIITNKALIYFYGDSIDGDNSNLFVDYSGAVSSPNLSNRFIVGSVLSYSLGSRGGSSTPSHTHKLDPSNKSTDSEPVHTHTVTGNDSDYFSNRKGVFSGCPDPCGGKVVSTTAHTHSVSSDGSHSHNLDLTEITSGSGSITNNPKFHSLYYIIKL